MTLCRWLAAPLLALLLVAGGWWVVAGYSYPPDLIAGPYAKLSDCNKMARDLNRIEQTYIYHCQYF